MAGSFAKGSSTFSRVILCRARCLMFAMSSRCRMRDQHDRCPFHRPAKLKRWRRAADSFPRRHSGERGGGRTRAQREGSMEAKMPDIQVVFERLEKLEKQNRRLKRAAALFVIFTSSLVLMSAAGHKGRTVEARQVVLKDDAGNTRAVLGMRS